MRIIRRAEWGAHHRARLDPIDWPERPTLYVHHTVSPPPPPHASVRQESAVMRGIDVFHLFSVRNPDGSRGWRGGIGYAYVVMPSGRVYEGRGEAVGAHARGANHLPSVALVGDYRVEAPHPNMIHSVFDLAALLGARDLAGHREAPGNSTTCPGARAMALVVNGRRPKQPPALVLPGDRTLRLTVRRPAGTPDLVTAGWASSRGALEWIAANGLQPEPPDGGRHWITWQGGTWFGAADVANVARNLVRRFL